MARRKPGASLAVHVPGVWSGALREIRDRASTAVWRYLESPVQVLTLERDESAALAERARRDADECYAERLAAREPVTASYAELRGCVPKDLLRAYRGVKQFTVFPDDTIEPDLSGR